MHNAAEGYITDVSYIPGFYPHLSPTAMRYVAAINRVQPPKTEQGFRYLELGCGLGGSLTTFAASNPQGEFTGVDINPEHTKLVERSISNAKLSNVHIITADFSQLPSDLGEFDFIVLHGVFSWVSQEVRDQIMRVAKSHLAKGGLLLVSYNAMPGWAHLQPIRGILRQYAELRQGDTLQRIRDAIAYLVYIRDKQAKYFVDNPQASQYVDSLLKQDVRYLAHEYLNESWTSFYFSDVSKMFLRAGMTFVGSLPVFTNFWDLCVRPEFQELFRTTSNRLVTESHKDFCANTAFRWDIYSHAPIKMPELSDRIQHADDIHYFVGKYSLKFPQTINLGVVTSTVKGPLYETLISLLSKQSMPLSKIICLKDFEGTQRTDVVKALDAGVAMGLIDLAVKPLVEVSPAHEPAIKMECLLNQVILASDSLGGRPITLSSTITGTGYSIGDFDALILQELISGGGKSLVSRVDEHLVHSGRSLQKDGKPINDSDTRLKYVKEACDIMQSKTLQQLARLGIISM